MKSESNKNFKAKFIIALSILLFLILFFGSAYFQRLKLLEIYETGLEKYYNDEYKESQEILTELGDYKDSFEYIKLASMKLSYIHAIELFDSGEYQKAIEEFSKLDNFEKSKEYIEKATELIEKTNAKEQLYNEAITSYSIKDYKHAINKFELLDDYKNSKQLLSECQFKLAQLQQATTISAGIRYSTGITSGGKIIYAGDNYLLNEELCKWEDIISVSSKGHLSIGLKEDGTVLVAGQIPNFPQYYIDASTWNDIIAVSTGQQYILGLRANGTLVAQGHNGDGQLNIYNWTNIVSIASGWRHTVGLDSNGIIHIAGYGSDVQLSKIEENKDKWTDIVAISAGGGSNSNNIHEAGHTVALKKDHTVVAVSSKCNNGHEYGCPCNVDEWTDIIAISAGDFHTVGLKSDGTVVTTQTGDSAEKISKWTDIVAISAGYGFTLGLKSNGEVVATGFDQNHQIDVRDWEKIIIYTDEWKSIFDESLRWTCKN